MLRVQTKLGPSPIEGIGVFAAENIRKGQLISRYVPGFDMLLTKEELSTRKMVLAPKLRRVVGRLFDDFYADNKRGIHSVSPDNTRFINHSNEPNTSIEWIEGEVDMVSHALTDISIGEELTCDYSLYMDITYAPFAVELGLNRNQRYMDEASPRTVREIRRQVKLRSLFKAGGTVQ